jgi:hypothetical protein
MRCVATENEWQRSYDASIAYEEERRRRPRDERARRRSFRIVIGVLASLVLVFGVLTAISFVAVRSLYLEHGTQAVVGTVVAEKKGPLGTWNELTVTYTVDGKSYRRTIPVKGDGFGGPRSSPYYYRTGAEVELLVRGEQPGSVRTATRWTPAFYEWSVLWAWSVVTLLGVAIVLLMRAKRPRT